jgi:uncharacterized delta-60 repeat protein
VKTPKFAKLIIFLMLCTAIQTLKTDVFAQQGVKKESQNLAINGAKPTKPTPSPTPAPTPLPDTKCYSGPGCLDTNFDFDGIATVNVISAIQGDVLEEVAIQPDGKTVGFGSVNFGTSRDFIVIRFELDGSLDTSFGDADPYNPLIKLGYKVVFATDKNEYCRTGTILDSGKILAAGYRYNESGPVSNLLVLLNPDGSLDTTFGVGGTVILDSPDLAVSDLTVQSDGKIILSGGGRSFALMRLNEDGSLDQSFGINGTATANPSTRSNGSGYNGSVAIQRIPAGSENEYIVTSGLVKDSPRGTTRYSVLRFTPDGDLDPTFGYGGRVSTNLEGGAHIVIDGQNRIVAGGISGFARYLEDGALDTSFSGDGIYSFNIYGGNNYIEDLAIQADDKVVGCVRAESSDRTFSYFSVVRLNTDGSPDASFGPGFLGAGVVTTNIADGVSQYPNGIAIGPGGDIVVGGVLDGPLAQITVVRYLP